LARHAWVVVPGSAPPDITTVVVLVVTVLFQPLVGVQATEAKPAELIWNDEDVEVISSAPKVADPFSLNVTVAPLALAQRPFCS